MKRIITWHGAGPVVQAAYRENKKKTFQNCAPFTDCIRKMNNTTDNVRDLDTNMKYDQDKIHSVQLH